MKRWITTAELGEALAARNPKVARLNAKRRNEHALREVRRAERLETVRYTKQVGKHVMISVRAVEVLLPPDEATVDRLGAEFSKMNQEHRRFRGRLKDHDRRIIGLEEKEAARREFEAKCAEIDRRAIAADTRI
jgi:hypothetical protein